MPNQLNLMLQLHNELMGFQLNEPIVVIPNSESTSILEYHQIGKVVHSKVSFQLMNLRNSSYSIITPASLQDSLLKLKGVLEDDQNNNYVSTAPLEMEFMIFNSPPNNHLGPYLVEEVRLCPDMGIFDKWKWKNKDSVKRILKAKNL